MQRLLLENHGAQPGTSDAGPGVEVGPFKVNSSRAIKCSERSNIQFAGRG
jgi:hypothetical protein